MLLLLMMMMMRWESQHWQQRTTAEMRDTSSGSGALTDEWSREI